MFTINEVESMKEKLKSRASGVISLVVFLVALVVMGNFFSIINASAPTNGLITYWNLDEGTGIVANDTSGNNNNGNLIGGPAWVAGKVGSSLSFTGNGKRVLATSDFVNTSALTACFWLFPPTYTSETFFSNGKFAITSASSSRFQMTSVGGTTYAISGANAVTLNTWNFICATRTASGIANLYKNAVLTGTANQNSGTPVAGIANVTMASNYNGGSPMPGILDEVRFYDRVLSTQEILDVYNAALGDVTAPALSNGSPSGTINAGVTQAVLSVITDETATCKYGTTSGVIYNSMANTFTTTGGTLHTQNLYSLPVDSTYYVRCQDGANNANASDYVVNFSVASGTGIPITTDLYIDAEAGNDGDLAIPSILTSGTHSAAGFTWSISDPFTAIHISDAFEPKVPVQIQVRGESTYTDTGTRSIEYDQNIMNQSTSVNLLQPRDVLTVSGFTQFNSISYGGSSENWDHFSMISPNGFQYPQGAVMQQRDYAGGNDVWVHVANRLGSSAGAPIPIVPGQIYWFTMNWDRAAKLVTLHLYDPLNWTLVGSSSDAIIDDEITPGNVQFINIGEDHSLSQDVFQYFDDIVIDWTTSLFPLIPASSPSDQTDPSLSLESLNATVSSITVSASGIDNVAISKVSFQLDGGAVIDDTMAPYQASWNTDILSIGSHSIIVTATDTSNNSTSLQASITVASQ